MPKTLPTISEADIRDISGDKVFERGRSYFRQGAILEPMRQGDQIRAYCEGSDYQPYQVTAEIGPNGLGSIDCTCPYDWGGACKHVVALLLTWLHQPESFQVIAPLDALLAGRSQEELVLLIKEMLKRQPDLARLLELPVQPERQTPLDLDAFRRQIDYALRVHDRDDYPDARATASELSSLAETADRFLQGGDWANAGALYALILAEIVPKYDELYDENGNVAIVLQQCAEGIAACFEQGSPDPDTRHHWLEVLLEAELKDVQMGGMDLAYPAAQVVIKQATDEEWAWIEARVEQAIANQTGRYSDWPREALVNFLARRLEASGVETQTDALIFEMGSPRQQAFLLVRRGRFAEAVALARQHFTDLPGLVTDFADALVAAGGGEQAEAYMASQVSTPRGSYYITWLGNYAEQSGQLATALQWWRQSLGQSPSLQTYHTLRGVAERLGQWQQTRLELLAELAEKEVWPVLIDIALEENDAARALELLSKLRGWFSSDYRLRVARAAETDFPQAALEIYRRRIDQLIGMRGRENYRSAAELLVRVRDIYRDQEAWPTWEKYIAHILKENSRLPALKDELRRVGL